MALAIDRAAPSAALARALAFGAIGAIGAGGCASRPPADDPGASAGAPAVVAAPAPASTIEAAAADPPSPAPAAIDPAPAPAPAIDPEPRPLPDRYLAFDRACEADGPPVTIAAVGDVLLHHELQIQAFAAADRHRDLWKNIDDLLARADVTYGNLEGPMAAGIDRAGAEVGDPGLVFDRVVYTAYPRFNFHPSVALDLKASGFDVVSTANNHALDRQAIGVDRTIEALRAAKLAFTGTRARGDQGAPWHAIVRRGDLQIAFLACTDLLNVRPDAEGQVLRCKGKPFEAELRALALRPGIDAVIVTPHWGKEYEPTPRASEVALARRWADAGATAILGSHPHVLQPWEKYVAADGREVFIHYSLGNFASHQPELPRRTTILLYLGLGRGADGVTRVRGVRHVPLQVRRDGDRYYTEAIDRVAGDPEARSLVVDLYGDANLLGEGEPLVIAPHCDPTWRPR